MDMQPRLWEKVLRAVNNEQQPTEEEWRALTPDEQELIDLLRKEKLTAHSVEFLNSMDENKAWLNLHRNIPRPLPSPAVRMRFLKYAAVLTGIFMLGAAALLLLKKDNSPRPVMAGTYITEPVNPKRATLVLADGRHIELTAHPDSSIQQGQTEIINIDTSLLKYTATAAAIKPAAFNTLIVPRGGLYKVQLADGTEVWLNAETKLRYPIHFGGVTKREVFLESGEAYFKVKHDAALPFIVKSGGVDIAVLGTAFNVNTYTKNHATTLAYGSVQLSAGIAATKLVPGEQGVYAEGVFIKKAVDADTYTAWRNGQIVFEEAPLEEVMNSLGRQYDFTFEFTSSELKERKFGGRLRRTAQIEDVLTIIEKAGYLTFSIQGKTIFVKPVLSK
jgi:transmembrane sensor